MTTNDAALPERLRGSANALQGLPPSGVTHQASDALRDAADTIERLSAEVEKERSDFAAFSEHHAATERMAERFRAEIERLSAAGAGQQSDIDITIDQMLPVEIQERIGATKDRETVLRVTRICAELEKLAGAGQEEREREAFIAACRRLRRSDGQWTFQVGPSYAALFPEEQEAWAAFKAATPKPEASAPKAKPAHTNTYGCRCGCTYMEAPSLPPAKPQQPDTRIEEIARTVVNANNEHEDDCGWWGGREHATECKCDCGLSPRMEHELVIARAVLREYAEALKAPSLSPEKRDVCPHCANTECICTHAWGESCRCLAEGREKYTERLAEKWEREHGGLTVYEVLYAAITEAIEAAGVKS